MENKFTKEFENKIKNTINKYKLIKKTDKILVACSGGKDSTTVLYVLHKLGYKTEAITIDLKIGTWSKRNLDNVKGFCKQHAIKLHVIDLRTEFGHSMCYIRTSIQEQRNLTNCIICGLIKKWLLNRKSRELKAKVIATGHNLDDMAETVMMNYLRGNPKLSIGLFPKSGVTKDKKFIQRIKPLYFCSNKENKEYSKLMKFPVLYEPCPCSTEVYRRQVRNQLNDLEKTHPKIKQNIVENFLKILPKLRSKYKTKEDITYCKACGEPSRNNICKTCELLTIFQKK